MKDKFIYSLSFFFMLFLHANACTIFSGIDSKGQVWAGNNEDNVFNFNSFFHTLARTDSSMGYIYFTNSERSNEYPQGGVNESGLFYDGHSVPPSVKATSIVDGLPYNKILVKDK